MTRPEVQLLTRDGCSDLRTGATRGWASWPVNWASICRAPTSTPPRAAGDPGLRAEFGDRLPVILLDGREHSYWEVDEPRLRADLAR